jgi:DNA replication protein DnaD
MLAWKKEAAQTIRNAKHARMKRRRKEKLPQRENKS